MLYSMKEIQFLYYVILQSIRSNIKYYIYIMYMYMYHWNIFQLHEVNAKCYMEC